MTGYKIEIEYDAPHSMGLAADLVIAAMQAQGLRITGSRIKLADHPLPPGSPYPDLTGLLEANGKAHG